MVFKACSWPAATSRSQQKSAETSKNQQKPAETECNFPLAKLSDNASVFIFCEHELSLRLHRLNTSRNQQIPTEISRNQLKSAETSSSSHQLPDGVGTYATDLQRPFSQVSLLRRPKAAEEAKPTPHFNATDFQRCPTE